VPPRLVLVVLLAQGGHGRGRQVDHLEAAEVVVRRRSTPPPRRAPPRRSCRPSTTAQVLAGDDGGRAEWVGGAEPRGEELIVGRGQRGVVEQVSASSGEGMNPVRATA
jgi:hypothetical protein